MSSEIVVNEFGTPISEFVCRTCGKPFTVTPAVPDDEADQWTDCLGEDCPSYEPTRDADLYFGLGMVERGDSDTPA